MTIQRFLASTACAVVLSYTASAFAADTAQDFVNKAAIGGMFEVETSKVALGKSQDRDVKAFAQKMIDDHGAANEKLSAIASEQKLKVPVQLDAEHKGHLDELNAANPVEGPYVDMQKSAHDDAVALFEAYANDGDNAALKAFASETLPTLKSHHDMVDGMKVGSSDAAPVNPAVSTDKGDAVAPVPGANSFTEAQAKSRIEEAGFSNVSGLTKDDQGIWRGQAVQAGKAVAVALDFQGNVVAVAN